MALPKNDLPVWLLQEMFLLVGGEIIGRSGFYTPRLFIRGEYYCLYISKSIHMAAHRVIWMLHHGVQIPRDEKGELYLIDHFDGNKLNNQTWNLRLASHSENMANRTKHHIDFSY